MPTRKTTTSPPAQAALFEDTDRPATRARTRVRYFAYGSNVDQEQMVARCPSARLVGTATLPDHGMAFAGNSVSRGGSVATVFACPGFVVPGALYSITREDLAALDRFEGVPWMYTRSARWVQTGERKRRAVVYRLQDEHVAAGVRRPAPGYLGQIILAYRRLGIPNHSITLALAIAARVERTQRVARKARIPGRGDDRVVTGPGRPARSVRRDEDPDDEPIDL